MRCFWHASRLQRDRAQTVLAQGLQQWRQGLQHHRAPSLISRRVAIVHEQYVSRCQTLGKAVEHRGCIARPGVVGAACPTGQSEATPSQYGIQEWVAQASHCTEKQGCSASYVLQGLLGVVYLPSHATGTVSGKTMGVRVGMVLDQMAASNDFLRQCRMLAHSFGDAKETGTLSGGFQQIKYPWGHFRVWSVIERERNLAARNGCGRQAGKVGTQQISAGQKACNGCDHMVCQYNT